MTLRLDVTTVTAESAVFATTTEWIVQVDASDPTTVFDIIARVDETAQWEVIDTVSVRDKIARYAAMPFVKIGVRNNLNGNAAKAWTNT